MHKVVPKRAFPTDETSKKYKKQRNFRLWYSDNAKIERFDRMRKIR